MQASRILASGFFLRAMNSSSRPPSTVDCHWQPACISVRPSRRRKPHRRRTTARASTEPVATPLAAAPITNAAVDTDLFAQRPISAKGLAWCALRSENAIDLATKNQ